MSCVRACVCVRVSCARACTRARTPIKKYVCVCVSVTILAQITDPVHLDSSSRASVSFAMSDRLETLNSVNASSKTLKVRVMMPFDRPTQGKLRIFGCFLVSETGAYTTGEALVFGDTPEKRQTALQALQKK